MFHFCRLRFRDVETPPLVDLIVSLLFPVCVFYRIPTLLCCMFVSSDGMCEDTVGYVDSEGYDCRDQIGYDCLDRAMYARKWGYSFEGWQDMVESCPESCGLCESSGENMESAVPQPYSL
jgi:hypothetical protein